MVLGLLFSASLVVNGVQGRRILRLEEVCDARAHRKKLAEGDMAPRLDLLNETGERIVINYSDAQAPTLLYLFSPECSWCERNANSFNELARQVKARVVGLSLSSGRFQGFLEKSRMPRPVYVLPHTAVASYGLGTPTTILVSQSGRILKIWSGAYLGETRTAIEEYFGITLPTETR